MSNNLKRKIITGLTGITIITGLSMAPAQAMIADNVQNAIGGGVNAHANNTCVEKVGDTAHVEFMMQHQPLLLSTDHNSTSNTGYIAIPKAMKNVKIQLEAIGTHGYDNKERYVKFEQPLDIDIEEFKDKNSSDIPSMPTLHSDGYSEITEENIKKSLKDFKMSKYTDSINEEPGINIVFSGNGSNSGTGNVIPWYGDHNDDYDYYIFGNTFRPATFKITGDIETNNEDSFVPAAITNIGWKGNDETTSGNYQNGFQNLAEYDWARVGTLPPVLPKDKGMIEAYKKNNSDDGLDFSSRIAPTKEIPGDAKYGMIGNDTRPSARGDIGYIYMNQYSLKSKPSVGYTGQVGHSGEDGADMAAAHITICDNEKPGEDTTSSTTTPTNPDNPGDKDTTTPTTKTTSKKEETPEDKTSSKTISTANKGNNDEESTTPTTTSVNNEKEEVNNPTQDITPNQKINTNNPVQRFTPVQSTKPVNYSPSVNSTVEPVNDEETISEGIKADTGSPITRLAGKILNIFN